MAGLFLGVFAPPVRCVAVIERVGRTRLDLAARTRPRCGQLCITRRPEHAGLQRFIRHLIFGFIANARGSPVRGPLVEQVADQTHSGHIADPVFGKSFVRPSLLRVRFRKMTGSACVRPNRSPKAPHQPAAQTAMPSPLSNPPETINLAPDSRAGNRAGRGSPQRRSLRLRRSGGGPIFEVPIRSVDRTGSGDLEKCVAGCFAVAHA